MPSYSTHLETKHHPFVTPGRVVSMMFGSTSTTQGGEVVRGGKGQVRCSQGPTDLHDLPSALPCHMAGHVSMESNWACLHKKLDMMR